MNDRPPTVRPLPRHQQHRRALLAMIDAESQAQASARQEPRALARVPRRGRGPAAEWLPREWPTGDGPARSRLARRSGWLAPLAAAAAVLVIASAAFGLQTLLRAGTGERPGHPGAAGTSVAGTVTATGSSVSAGPAPAAGSRPVPLPGGRWQVTRQYQVNAPVSSLVVNDPTGSVQVTGGTGSGVSVTAVINYADSAPSIGRQLAGGALTVGYSSCGDCGVGFVIAVPRGTAVTVREGTGHVGLAGIAGDASVQVGTGSITGTDVSGAVDQFRTGTGGISVRFSAPPARLTAETETGIVVLAVPADTVYRVSANSGMGAANVTVPQSASATHEITATAGTGGVTVTSAN